MVVLEVSCALLVDILWIAPLAAVSLEVEHTLGVTVQGVGVALAPLQVRERFVAFLLVEHDPLQVVAQRDLELGKTPGS